MDRMRSLALISWVALLCGIGPSAFGADMKVRHHNRHVTHTRLHVASVSQCYTGWWLVHRDDGLGPYWNTRCRAVRLSR